MTGSINVSLLSASCSGLAYSAACHLAMLAHGDTHKATELCLASRYWVGLLWADRWRRARPAPLRRHRASCQSTCQHTAAPAELIQEPHQGSLLRAALHTRISNNLPVFR